MTRARKRGTRVWASIAAVAMAVTGLGAIMGAGPASAMNCPQILSARPGSTAGSIHVTFTDTRGPYTVEAYAQELFKGKPTPVASMIGAPGGTDVTGLAYSTPYWIYVNSDGRCYSDGVLATSSGAGGTNLWMQAYGRPSQESPCDAGWWGSYAMWPNSGLGGWTCERYLTVYG